MNDLDPWRMLYLGAAALFVAVQMVMGWRRGVVRQAVALAALAAAYAAGYFGAHWTVPLVRPLGLPDFVCAGVGGCLLALATFACITITGDILFKRTAQQPLFLLRWIYGAGGALFGLLFGLLAVWVATVGIRCLGTIAEAELASVGHEPLERRAVVSGLARLKGSLDHGTTGAMIDRFDPVPHRFYELLNRVTRMASDADSAARFLAFPGAAELSNHPRIVALRNDPAIQEALGQRDFIALLTNEHLVRAANDPEVQRLVRRFELEKALDHALQR